MSGSGTRGKGCVFDCDGETWCGYSPCRERSRLALAREPSPLRYNLFYDVDVLSFFDRAMTDPRWVEAYEILASKRDVEGRRFAEIEGRRRTRTVDGARDV